MYKIKLNLNMQKNKSNVFLSVNLTNMCTIFTDWLSYDSHLVFSVQILFHLCSLYYENDCYGMWFVCVVCICENCHFDADIKVTE